MSDQPTGSCLCGSVRFQVEAPFQTAVNCHCNRCKKITGAAFESIALAPRSAFVLLDGEELLTAYHLSELASKHFCSRCGTPIYNLHARLPGRVIIHIGALDEPAGVTPSANIFCESMLPWVPAIGTLQSFPQEFGSSKP